MLVIFSPFRAAQRRFAHQHQSQFIAGIKHIGGRGDLMDAHHVEIQPQQIVHRFGPTGIVRRWTTEPGFHTVGVGSEIGFLLIVAS